MAAFVDEFDLWRVGGLWVSHWDEAVEDEDAERVGGLYIVCPQEHHQPLAPTLVHAITE
jgi:hypothetical protein